MKSVQVYSVRFPFSNPSDDDLNNPEDFKKKSVQLVYSDELESSVFYNEGAIYEVYRAFAQVVQKDELSGKSKGALTPSIRAASFSLYGKDCCGINAYEIPSGKAQANIGAEMTDFNLLYLYAERAILIKTDPHGSSDGIEEAIGKIAAQSRFMFAPMNIETFQATSQG